MNYQTGYISEVDAGKGLARVQFPDLDGMVSNWLHMIVPGTLADKFSSPFHVNEHVACILDENLEYGCIVGAIYSEKDTPGSIGNADIVGVAFEHGLNIKYKRSDGTLSITGSGKVSIDITGEVDIKASTKVTLQAVTEIDMTAPLIKVTGEMTVAGEITAGGISIQTGLGGGSGKMVGDGDIQTTGKITGAEIHEGLFRLGTHKHLGVTTGTGTSGLPTP